MMLMKSIKISNFNYVAELTGFYFFKKDVIFDGHYIG